MTGLPIEHGQAQLDGRGVAVYGRAGNQDEQLLGMLWPADGWNVTNADVAGFYREVAAVLDSDGSR